MSRTSVTTNLYRYTDITHSYFYDSNLLQQIRKIL